MTKRLPQNTNLTLHTAPQYRGLNVQTQHGPLIQNYLERAYQTVQNALTEHPRTYAIRVDLHYPPILNCLDYPWEYIGNEISKFSASLKAQVKYDRSIKAGTCMSVHPCTVRIICAYERANAVLGHYHLVILFNRDAYGFLGDLSVLEGNTSARIRKAWASALKLDIDDVIGLVHFPENPTYRINANADTYHQELNELFYRISYLCKAKTKHFGNHSNSFNSSNK